MSALTVAMSSSEATQVTARIKLLITTITDTTSKTISLIEQAEAGRAWQAMGYDSWPAYVAAEFGDALAGLARAERIPITAKLSETGMSTRVIATVTGVGKSTIDRDLEQVSRTGTPATTTTIGHDGKTYIRNGRPTSRGMQELAEAVPPVRPRPRRRPLPDQYHDALCELEKVNARLEKLQADDRFDPHDEEYRERLPLLTAQLNRMLDLVAPFYGISGKAMRSCLFLADFSDAEFEAALVAARADGDISEDNVVAHLCQARCRGDVSDGDT